MRLELSQRLAALAGLFVAALATGCTTVVLSDSSEQERTAVEHAALVEAAAAIARTPWPKPESASWTDRLAGATDTGPRISHDDAARTYVETLPAPRKDAALGDAAQHLGAARALVLAAEAASGALRPAMSDVSVVEKAILDLREARDVYLASLKLIARAGEPVASTESRRLKAEFGAVIEDLGAAADRLADEAENDPRRTFAGPAARFLN